TLTIFGAETTGPPTSTSCPMSGLNAGYAFVSTLGAESAAVPASPVGGGFPASSWGLSVEGGAPPWSFGAGSLDPLQAERTRAEVTRPAAKKRPSDVPTAPSAAGDMPM